MTGIPALLLILTAVLWLFTPLQPQLAGAALFFTFLTATTWWVHRRKA